ncbi:MAG: ABC transporter permease [Acidimicrobiia bacterium]|nr:ABC transporter permease [Acidimicrobiia bacterium]
MRPDDGRAKSAGAGLVARAVLRDRWRSLIGLALVLAMLGGIGMTALAGARRTQSAYPRFLRWAHVSTMAVDAGTNRNFLSKVERFPEVVRHRRYTAVDAGHIFPNGAPDLSMIQLEALVSVDGRYFDQDRFAATEGRRPDPNRVDEVAFNLTAARLYHLHVGQRLDIGAFDDDEVSQTEDPSTLRPKFRMKATIVGIGLFPEEVVQDESDRSPLGLFTLAYFEKVEHLGTYSWEGLVLRHGDKDVVSVKRRYHDLVASKGFPEFYRVTSVDTFHSLQAVRPLSLALGIFGLIAVVVAVVLTGLSVTREIGAVVPARRDLRALGVTGRVDLLAAVVGPGIAIIAGVVGAALLAFMLSPVMPLGQVRRVEVDRGFDIDWTVLGLGALALVVVLGVVAVVTAVVTRPRAARVQRSAARTSRLSAAMSRMGLGPTNALGLRLAFGSQDGAASPSVLVGGAVAIGALVAAVTFSASLHGLVRKPALYGWQWQGVAVAGAGYFNIPQQQIRALRQADPDIESTTGVHFGSGSIDGINVPLLGYDAGTRVTPPITGGRAPRSTGEIALGSETARQLGVDLGDVVHITTDQGGVRARRVVGFMVFPTLGIIHGAHTSLGTGAWVTATDVPGVGRQDAGLPPSALGPNALFIRLRPGHNGPAEMRALRRATSKLQSEAGVTFSPVQRPAEIVNTKNLDSAPAILSAVLLAGALLALAVTLSATVRRRRSELAVLKSLGMTRRQLSGMVSWQSTAVVIAGLVVGVPLGVAFGRWIWTRFADGLDVVADPRVPWAVILLIAGALVLVANLVAVVPGRLASRTAIGPALQAD